MISACMIGHIPKHAPIHEYRADFTRELDARLARPIEKLPKSKQYICRGDRYGAIYDKDALPEIPYHRTQKATSGSHTGYRKCIKRYSSV